MAGPKRGKCKLTSSRKRPLGPLVAVASWCVMTGAPAQAQDAPDTRERPVVVKLTRSGDAPELSLNIQSLDDGKLAVVIVSVSAAGCLYPEFFELPIQLNSVSFQLKRVLRMSQKRHPDGTCFEGLATVYDADNFHLLASAASVTVHLPTGAKTFPTEALDYAKSVAPSVYPPKRDDQPSDYVEVVSMLNGLIANGRADEAVGLAESVAPVFASRPAPEGLAFYAMLGMARRRTSNLDGGALCYQIALMIADASGNSSAAVGVLYDNLATVRDLQRRWEEADAASDRAIALLTEAGTKAQGSLGGALNNRALQLADRGQFESALTYSERALTILREVFKRDEAGLQPFLDDNRMIRNKLRPSSPA